MKYQRLKREFSILFDALYQLIKGDFSYHAGALTYNFLMVIGSFFSALSILALYTPLLGYERILSIAVQVFPQYTNEVIMTVSKFYQSKATFSFVSFAFAYLFSVSFIKNLYKAFVYVKCDVKRKSELSFWIFLPFFTFTFFLFYTVIVVIHALLRFFMVSVPFTLVINLLFFFVVLFVTYRYFINANVASIFYVSFLVSILLYFFNKFFVSLLIKFVTLNPLYGLLGSFLIFLVWLHLSFQLMLFGAKIFTYKERE